MTRDEALALGYGDWLYHRAKRQGRGAEPLRVRVAGRVRTWVRDPARIEIPTKWGTRSYHTITEHELGEWYTSEAAVEQFRAAHVAVQSEFGLAPDAEEAARLAADAKKVKELVDLLTFALLHGMHETAERATAGLDRLGARQTVVEIVDRYNRGLPPFRGAKGRFRTWMDTSDEWKKGEN